jgi:nucleotide-binding universal stress UspA family protein
MLTILTATDLSVQSRAGLRFAMQWSTQQKIKLIFFHIFNPIRLPQWTNEQYAEYIKHETLSRDFKLNQYIKGLYKATNISPGKYLCVVRQGISADVSIGDYCREQGNIDFICIATHGARKVERLFGTRTGNLITKSEVPVVAIPEKYKRKPIRRIAYAADFNGYKDELKRVEGFARPLQASIEVLHLGLPYEVLPDEATLSGTHYKQFPFGVEVGVKRTNPRHSFFRDLKEEIEKSNPSLIIMFTDQHRDFLDRILFPSKAERLSFDLPVPLLVFPKK